MPTTRLDAGGDCQLPESSCKVVMWQEYEYVHQAVTLSTTT